MLKLSMLIISYNEDNMDRIVSEARRILTTGGFIAYPTESYYALGVLATDEEAVERLYELKKRPADKPLPVIVGSADGLLSIVKNVPGQAKSLMEKFWPGPLTLIFNAADTVPALLTGGTGRVAVRIPGESAALRLAGSIKLPITSTSANPSGEDPADTVNTIIKYFREEIDLIIDAGKTPGGRPSTIVDVTVTPPVVLREGSLLLEKMQGIIHPDRH
ncbi:MAG: L-threonylcarbamoyladenylate synthase [Nitrospirota bacterium]|nr:L-threonylcarbamoyladenylate synthase [Nitrospirota bacterium]